MPKSKSSKLVRWHSCAEARHRYLTDCKWVLLNALNEINAETEDLLRCLKNASAGGTAWHNYKIKNTKFKI